MLNIINKYFFMECAAKCMPGIGNREKLEYLYYM